MRWLVEFIFFIMFVDKGKNILFHLCFLNLLVLAAVVFSYRCIIIFIPSILWFWIIGLYIFVWFLMLSWLLPREGCQILNLWFSLHLDHIGSHIRLAIRFVYFYDRCHITLHPNQLTKASSASLLLVLLSTTIIVWLGDCLLSWIVSIHLNYRLFSGLLLYWG